MPTCAWVEVTVCCLCVFVCLCVLLTCGWVKPGPWWSRHDIPVRSFCPPLCHPLLMLGWPSPHLLSTHTMLLSPFSLSPFIFFFFPLFLSSTLNMPFLSPFSSSLSSYLLLFPLSPWLFSLPPLRMTLGHLSDKLYPYTLSSPTIAKHNEDKHNCIDSEPDRTRMQTQICFAVNVYSGAGGVQCSDLIWLTHTH